MDDFLGNDNLVGDIPTGNKSNLILSNDFGENKLEPVSNNLHDQLVKDSVKTDGSKLRESLGVMSLRIRTRRVLLRLASVTPLLKTFLTQS